jgi:DNA-binding LytR/AlgR family response regulator
MPPMRVLIVDDEPLALERLSGLLAEIPDAKLVAKLQNGADAVAAIAEHQPDLVLLDVEMPRVDGFDVVDSLLERCRSADSRLPLICFVTAYPQFATDAFDTGALDYLCKPVRLARLQKTFSRARTALAQRDAAKRLEELAGQLEGLRHARASTGGRHLWVHQRGEMVRLEIPEIDWLEAEGEYVRLHFGEKSYLHRASISSICSELEPEGFVRIHRSAIVNLARLKAVRRQRSGVSVLLDRGIELRVGRKYRHSLRHLDAASGHSLDA